MRHDADPLQNQHRVTEAVEAIPPVYRLPVRFASMSSRSAKALTSMSKGRLGQVEVGHEGIDHPKRIAGIDEDIGPARTRRERIRASPHLPRVAAYSQQPDGGRPDGYDSPTFSLGAVDRLPRSPHLMTVKFGVHVVMGDVFDLHGTKRGPSNVQRDEGRLDSMASYSLHETLRKREVPPSALRHSLAPESRRSGIVQGLPVALGCTAVAARPRSRRAAPRSLSRTVREPSSCASSTSPSIATVPPRSSKVVPGVIRRPGRASVCQTPGELPTEQQQLDLRARVHADAIHPRRKHPAVVEYHHVAGTKVFEQFGKDPMLEPPRLTMHDHQPGTVPRLNRPLGDQFRREVVAVCFKAQVVVRWHGARLSVGWRRYAIFAVSGRTRKADKAVRGR